MLQCLIPVNLVKKKTPKSTSITTPHMPHIHPSIKALDSCGVGEDAWLQLHARLLGAILRSQAYADH